MKLDREIASLVEQLAQYVGKHCDREGLNPTQIEGLEFYRQNAASTCTVCAVEPSIALVVQGRKSMTLGEQEFQYNPSRFLLTSLDLPAKMQVLEASEEKPYLGVVLKINSATLRELLLQAPCNNKVEATGTSMALGTTTFSLLDAFLRLIALLDDETSLPVLAPLFKREIFWRVLTSDQGARLQQIVSAGSHDLRIGRVIEWLKSHFDQELSIEDMASLAQMSKSTFHHHFRQLTSMSPVQYKKRLRLMEARRLMIAEDYDAAAAAYRVGYESPSQFSREYSRLFGRSPKRDVEEQLRQVS
jgi:AraC-like DNA-binding protein